MCLLSEISIILNEENHYLKHKTTDKENKGEAHLIKPENAKLMEYFKAVKPIMMKIVYPSDIKKNTKLVRNFTIKDFV
jgi:hypothetical protein